MVHIQAQHAADVKREEQQLVEAQATPLRNYLMQNVMPTMTLGLIECCNVRPDDPIDFLVYECILINIQSIVINQSVYYHRQFTLQMMI